MKIFAVYDPAQFGRVVQICDAPEIDDLADWLVSQGWEAVELPDRNVPGEAWVADGQLNLVPAAPSSAHAWNWQTKTWAPSAAKKWDEIRKRRVRLLGEADVEVNKAEDTGVDPTPWRQYRQALRNVTNQPDPFNITWPTRP